MPPAPATLPRGDTLSYQELEQLWIQAGGNRLWAPIMAAVALAESHGRRFARRYVPSGPRREDSRGPWQINVFAHPEYAHANLYDPATNARAAVDVFNRAGGASPWTTYRSGAWKPAFNAARGHDDDGGFLQRLPGSIAGGIGRALIPGGVGLLPLPHIPGTPHLPSTSDVGGAIGDVEHWVEQKAVLALGYLVFTGVALLLFGLGMRQLTGVSAQRLVAERASAAAEPGHSQDDPAPLFEEPA